jgi:hypothetical protein
MKISMEAIIHVNFALSFTITLPHYLEGSRARIRSVSEQRAYFGDTECRSSRDGTRGRREPALHLPRKDNSL